MEGIHKLENIAAGKTIEQALKHIKKDPEKNMLTLINFAENIAKDDYGSKGFEAARKIATDENNTYHKMVMNILDNVDLNIIKTLGVNFGLNAAVYGNRKRKKLQEELNCRLPWTILIDPTSACNLKCTGCWAAEYGHNMSLSNEEIDDLINQGKEQGIYFYILSGGEPLVRRDDILDLCEKHNDCAFLAFTNGTLITEEFAERMAKVGNLSLALSVEGSAETTDARRGEGCYERVMKGMDILKQHKCLFGFSVCYTSKNTEVVSSDEFIKHMVDKGCLYGWYFTYMPVGKDAAPELIATPEQRNYMYHKIRASRSFEGGNPIYLMDFQNDGEFVGGCIAGGKCYAHINANGDVEPCVFVHYSQANIRDMKLIDALQQPLFKAYQKNQPFNCNHLRPCPMLENPECLRAMIKESGAKSTDMIAPEDVEQLCGKCDKFAEEWAPVAEQLWKDNKHYESKM